MSKQEIATFIFDNLLSVTNPAESDRAYDISVIARAITNKDAERDLRAAESGDAFGCVILDLRARITALEARLETAKSALEFYGDKFNWLLLENTSNMQAQIQGFDLQEFRPAPSRKSMLTGGLCARQALAAIREGK